MNEDQHTTFFEAVTSGSIEKLEKILSRCGLSVTKSLAEKKNDLGKTAFLVAIKIGKLVEFSVKNIKFNTNQTICFIWNEGRYEYSPPIFASVLSSRLLILHLLVISKNVWSTE